MTRRLQPAWVLLTLASLAAVAGCTTAHSFNDVEIAKTALLGFTEEDMRMCAGFPTRTSTDGGTTIWSYETEERSGGLNLSAPIFFGAANTNLSLPSGGSCHAQFRFVDGRLDRIAYAGNNDTARGRDTMCTQVVDDCITYGRAYTKGRYMEKLRPPPNAN